MKSGCYKSKKIRYLGTGLFSMEMKEYLFSYGTLQKEKVQLDLFGRILKGSMMF
jgi:hypothetical protein